MQNQIEIKLDIPLEKIRTSCESLQSSAFWADRFTLRANLLRLIQESVSLLQLLDDDEKEQNRKRQEAKYAALREKEAARMAALDTKLT